MGLHDPRSLGSRDGMQVLFHQQPDGTILIEHKQDVTAYLDSNKDAQTYTDKFARRKREGSLAVHAAHIPPVIVVKWLNEDGLNVFDPDHAPRLRRKLNDPEWAYLRTDPLSL